VDVGAVVDWELLENGPHLSTTETAMIFIAHGCALLECYGRLPPDLWRVVSQVLMALSLPDAGPKSTP
jgi:hypothetical protein